jgi:hypothetical protein
MAIDLDSVTLDELDNDFPIGNRNKLEKERKRQFINFICK